jgi:hypothetical protein
MFLRRAVLVRIEKSLLYRFTIYPGPYSAAGLSDLCLIHEKWIP